MTVEHLEVLVEEYSAERALSVLLPRLLGDTEFAIHSHQGKQDLLARLPDRLRAYRKWIPATWRVVVLVDRDGDDCVQLKSRLEDAAAAAKCPTRRTHPDDWFVVTRLAIEELEAWYFGDWAAVRRAYPRVPATVPARSGYRDPDSIAGGTWEAFERIMQRAGYFAGGLPKAEAANAIAAEMDPAVNTSRSFQAFRDALMELTA